MEMSKHFSPETECTVSPSPFMEKRETKTKKRNYTNMHKLKRVRAVHHVLIPILQINMCYLEKWKNAHVTREKFILNLKASNAFPMAR